MKISEKRRTEMYSALHNSMVRIRVAVEMAKKDGMVSNEAAKRLDKIIFDETEVCWRDIKEVLGITD